MVLHRQEILEKFKAPVYIPHILYDGFETFSNLSNWPTTPCTIELPGFKIVLTRIDYLRRDQPSLTDPFPLLRFQQDTFRLFYQIEGFGILHNASLNLSGSGRSGLLGVMNKGERHTYLHQKGLFECFTASFHLLPAKDSKNFWECEILGKHVVDSADKLFFENLVFELLSAVANNVLNCDVTVCARFLRLIEYLFSRGIIAVDNVQFPKNKSRFLINIAREFMNNNYASKQTQLGLQKACGVNINYLNILFKKETGKTLYHYLTNVRMEHARYLLEQGDGPITDIATRVGYPNANSFTRIFRKLFNKTPSDYQQDAVAQSAKRR